MYVIIKNNNGKVADNILFGVEKFAILGVNEMGIIDRLTQILKDRNPNKNETPTFVKIESVYEPLSAMRNGVRKISHYEFVFHISTDTGFSFSRIEKPFIMKEINTL